jgi:hypothetical protein
MQKEEQSVVSSAPAAFAFVDSATLIAGPTYSGSLDSFVPLADEFEHTKGIEPLAGFLGCSSGFPTDLWPMLLSLGISHSGGKHGPQSFMKCSFPHVITDQKLF